MSMLLLISAHSGSPTSQLLRLLDKEIDALMDDKATVEEVVHKARAGAFTEALQVLTCANEEEVKNVAMLRWESRNPEAPGEEDEHG